MDVSKLDSSDMRGSLATFPNQFAVGFSLSEHIHLPGKFSRVVVAGMGGSANFVDLINCIFIQELPEPIRICRNYSAPANWLTPETLLIVCSFSGNTEETLSVYVQAKTAGCTVVAITAGGRLQELAMSDGFQVIKLEKPSPNFQPRVGLGLFFASITNTLIAAGWLSESLGGVVMQALGQIDLAATEESGKQLANILVGRIPVFYAPDHLWPVARIAKINVNENAKVPAFWNFLPEADHNEMMGFMTTKDPYTIVMLRDPADHPQNIKRFDVTGNIYRELGLQVVYLDMEGETIATKAIQSMLLGMWAGYYMAIKAGIDPAPVPLVEKLKTALV